MYVKEKPCYLLMNYYNTPAFFLYNKKDQLITDFTLHRFYHCLIKDILYCVIFHCCLCSGEYSICTYFNF